MHYLVKSVYPLPVEDHIDSPSEKRRGEVCEQ